MADSKKVVVARRQQEIETVLEHAAWKLSIEDSRDDEYAQGVLALWEWLTGLTEQPPL